ncbi:MAG: cytochrome c oxidase subunit II [Planctomycetes bacterium]|nr:cytochrome c oxidase subunit II [Planctomycetota bacterium]
MAIAGAAFGALPEICATTGGDLPNTTGEPGNVVLPSILDPHSPPARLIRELSWLVLGICAGLFVLVEGMIFYGVVKYRRRRDDKTKDEPRQVYGSNPVEIAWTIIPLLIVFVLTLTTVRTIRSIELTQPPADALHVVAIGHQWWWEYRYPDPDGTGGEVIVANEMHVPVNRPVWVRLESADVIHSWWVPALTGKTDLLPNHTNHTWFNAENEGIYLGQCAEYCGNQHAGMLLRVVATQPEEFDAWLRAQAAPTVHDTTVAEGREIFQEFACSNCHTVKGVSDGQFAPDLTHLMSRQTIASGVAPLDAATLKAWIADPQILKPGCNMPSLQLDPQELDAVTSYLLTLR